MAFTTGHMSTSKLSFKRKRPLSPPPAPAPPPQHRASKSQPTDHFRPLKKEPLWNDGKNKTQFAPQSSSKIPKSSYYKPIPTSDFGDDFISIKEEKESLWSDVKDESEQQDSRQAEWAAWSGAVPKRWQNYDTWADGIREGMEVKREKGPRNRYARRRTEGEKSWGRGTKEELHQRRKGKAQRKAADALRDPNSFASRLTDGRQKYRSRWTTLKAAPPNTLDDRDLPIPSLSQDKITANSIHQFLFEGCEFTRDEKRKMVKDSLLLWHPDKFGKMLEAFKEEKRTRVAWVAQELSKALTELYGTFG
ncbi:uncharacterized protein EV422DRAFT_52122 [Fimicolochytrium jonesii]|uniref:uncharacterized protein n=1 Tax=Fimicolochytrium jonesii TaxID=1396493 RepID=UPI0022FEFA3D|nr:uncharacterized protein EV422DRAFT_52122 [Fimicolochytrium jonesii]KAI8821094.1 hypothetical protein EV422DRAFT_52122 [Fimicolochytrium jonesii]